MTQLTSVQVKETTRDRLREACIKRDSYDKTINMALDDKETLACMKGPLNAIFGKFGQSDSNERCVVGKPIHPRAEAEEKAYGGDEE